MTTAPVRAGSLAAIACLAVLPGRLASAQPQPTPTPDPVPLVVSTLGSPANTDALVSPNTFVVMSDETRDLPMFINAPPSIGPVKLSATCCTDPATGQPISANPASPTVSISPSQLARSGSATLTVAALRVPTIAFLVTIHADSAARRYHASGAILVNVVKVPVDDTLCSGAVTPGSATSAETLPDNKAIAEVFTAKQATPSLTSWQVAAATKDGRHGWTLTIDSGGRLASTMSTVVFSNSTSLDKRIVPFDTSSCAATLPSANFIASPGSSVTIPISSPSTTTLVLQAKVCRAWFLGCWSYGFDDIAVFSAPPFWTLFGGRRVTIRWISGGADR